MARQNIAVGAAPNDNSGDTERAAWIKANANFLELYGLLVGGPFLSETDAHLLGVPTAPTAALGTNTTQIATMAAIKAAIDALVAGAPGALDTLNEIATQLASDESAVSALVTAVAGKQAASANLTTFAGIAPSANVQTLLNAANFAAILAAIGAQPADADLTAFAALVGAANKVPYYTAAGAMAIADFTAAGRALVGAANAAAQRAALLVTSSTPGFVTGRYYWFYEGPQYTAVAATLAGRVTLAPMFIKQGVTLSELAIGIGTVQAGGNIALAVYAMDAATKLPVGAPLANTGNLSTAVAGMVSGATAGGNVTFAEGWYWCAVMVDNTVATYSGRTNSNAWTSVHIGSTTLANLQNASNRALAYKYDAVYGTWPNLTTTPATETIAVEPFIAAKIA